MPAGEVLRKEAEAIDNQFAMFKEDLENYAQCIRQFIGVSGEHGASESFGIVE